MAIQAMVTVTRVTVTRVTVMASRVTEMASRATVTVTVTAAHQAKYCATVSAQIR
jgi:hypothetical protein